MSRKRPTWKAGLTLRRNAEGMRYVLVSAHLGKAWAIDGEQFLAAHLWISRLSDRRPAVIDSLIEAGLVENQHASSQEAPASATSRLHAWSNHSPYLDLHDPTGEIRRQVVTGFRRPSGQVSMPADFPALQGLTAVRLAAGHPVATIVTAATHRRREVASLAATSADPIAYLLSYGAAFSLIVLASAVDGLDDGCYLAQDMDPLTYFPHDVDRSLLATVMEWEGAAKPSLVLICVGDFERYRDRYRHEQAIRGFFVDGGRLFHEIVAALNGLRLNSLRFASFPLSGTFGEALRLEKMRHIPFGAVNISGPGRLTIESLRSCEGLARR